MVACSYAGSMAEVVKNVVYLALPVAIAHKPPLSHHGRLRKSEVITGGHLVGWDIIALVLVVESTWLSKQALVRVSLPLLQVKEASLPTNVYWITRKGV